ncbi:hypothetical protein MJO29_013549 [Puccinia striiformis f. sp. tritici]|nr:hypothetical protein MJO29_013549 [Puccinia striiformis f. sp. tritici]
MDLYLGIDSLALYHQFILISLPDKDHLGGVSAVPVGDLQISLKTIFTSTYMSDFFAMFASSSMIAWWQGKRADQ